MEQCQQFLPKVFLEFTSLRARQNFFLLPAKWLEPLLRAKSQELNHRGSWSPKANENGKDQRELFSLGQEQRPGGIGNGVYFSSITLFLGNIVIADKVKVQEAGQFIPGAKIIHLSQR
jgi:hypothetical protein